MLKHYFWLAHLLLVMLTATLGAEMVQSYRNAKLSMPGSRELAPPRHIPDPPTPAAWSDYQIIATQNLFNAKSAVPESEKLPPPISPNLQATPLPSKLVGTVIGTNNQHYAIIEDLRMRGGQAVYQIGDVIQRARLADIHPTCVRLDTEEQYDVLCFQHDESVANSLRWSMALPPVAP